MNIKERYEGVLKGQRGWNLFLTYSVIFGIMAIVISSTSISEHGWLQFAITIPIAVLVNVIIGLSYFLKKMNKMEYIGGHQCLSALVIDETSGEKIAEDMIILMKQMKETRENVYEIRVKNVDFDSAELITRKPFREEFNFGTSEIEVDGWYAYVLSTPCVLRVEKWISKNKPLLRVEWSIQK